MQTQTLSLRSCCMYCTCAGKRSACNYAARAMIEHVHAIILHVLHSCQQMLSLQSCCMYCEQACTCSDCRTLMLLYAGALLEFNALRFEHTHTRTHTCVPHSGWPMLTAAP
eukprot:1158651-Pelagomonas_calceolata.AAC.1